MSSQWIKTALDEDQLVHIFVSEPEEIGIGRDRERTKNKQVFAPLPEQFAFSLGNDYSQTFDFWKIKDKLFLGSSVIGVNANKGFAERQFWTEVVPQDWTIDLTFEAYYSSILDVMEPTKYLLQMAAAKEKTLTSKGTQSAVPYNLDEYWSRPPKVYIYIGKSFRFKNVGIKNISVTYSNKLDNEGFPMSATVSLTFTTPDPIGYHALHELFWKHDLNG